MQLLTIGKNQAGQRLDKFLKKRYLMQAQDFYIRCFARKILR